MGGLSFVTVDYPKTLKKQYNCNELVYEWDDGL